MPNDTDTELITGRNPVLEAIKSGRPLNKVFIAGARRTEGGAGRGGVGQRTGGMGGSDGAFHNGGALHTDDALRTGNHDFTDSTLRYIESLARGRGIPVMYADRAWLDKLAQGPCQGVAAYASAKEYCDVRDILEYAGELNEKPLILVANGILDPNNLGAMLRSAEAAGAHGVIIPKRNAAGLTGAAARASAGAIEYIRVARVANIAAALRDLKKQGVWIVGAEASGKQLYADCDMSGATAIVVGGEGGGLGRLVSETCDYVVRLPMHGKITSLNASAATAVLIYEALRQRRADIQSDKPAAD